MFTTRRITLVAVLWVVALVAACGPSATPAKPEDPTLKIGLLPILEAVPLFVAEQEGYFKDEGVAVTFVPASSAVERDTFMTAGQIDGMINDLVSTALYNKDGAKILVVHLARQAYPTAAQFGILVGKDSGINTVSDLKGVEIGISENTVIEYTTVRMLERAGLGRDDVKFVNVAAIPTRLQLLGEGKLKAANLPDPFLSLAVQQGARVLIDDTKTPDISVSVLSFRVDALKDKPNTVKKFLRAYEKAVKAMNANPAKYQSLVVDKKLVPAPIQATYKLPPFPETGVPSEAQFKDVVDWLKSKGLVKSDIPYSQLVDASFLPK